MFNPKPFTYDVYLLWFGGSEEGYRSFLEQWTNPATSAIHDGRQSYMHPDFIDPPSPREEFEQQFGKITDEQWEWLKGFCERNPVTGGDSELKGIVVDGLFVPEHGFHGLRNFRWGHYFPQARPVEVDESSRKLT